MGSGRGSDLILLDTHTLIWLDLRQPALGRHARSVCEEAAARGELSVSAISFWEVARLLSQGRFELDVDVSSWRSALVASGLHELVVDGAVGIRAALLQDLHRDPADRIIVATALLRGARLLTADRRILDWPGDLARHDART